MRVKWVVFVFYWEIIRDKSWEREQRIFLNKCYLHLPAVLLAVTPHQGVHFVHIASVTVPIVADDSRRHVAWDSIGAFRLGPNHWLVASLQCHTWNCHSMDDPHLISNRSHPKQKITTKVNLLEPPKMLRKSWENVEKMLRRCYIPIAMRYHSSIFCQR